MWFRNMKQKLGITNYLVQMFWALALIIIASVYFVNTAYAQGPNMDDEVNRIGKYLYCPVCPTTPLDQCNTEACSRWRAQIKEMLVSGKNEDQIRNFFVSQYGERVLGAPPAQGFNWLAYLLPSIAVLVGGVFVGFAVRNRLAHRPPESSKATPIPSQYADRIEQELKEN